LGEETIMDIRGVRRVGWSGLCNASVLRPVILFFLVAGSLFLIFAMGTQQATAQLCPECECKVCHGPVGPHSGGYPGCDACHGNPPINSSGLVWYPASTGATTAGAHSKHATSEGYNYSCVTCHFNGMPATAMLEDPPLLQMGFSVGTGGGTYDGRVLQSPYLYDATNGTTVTTNGSMTCSNIYCHSNGTSVATGTIPANSSPSWATVGPLACTSCHAYPPLYAQDQPKSNSHSRHTFATCNTCHFATTTDGITITNVSNHANAAYNVVPDPNASYLGTPVSFSYAFDPGGGHCSNISCHLNSNVNNVWGGVILAAGIGWTAGPACLQVQFTGLLNGTPPETFLWNFGDSQTGEGENINHTYAQAGSYAVQLAAKDVNRHSATASTVVAASTFNLLPVPDFTVTVSGLTVTVTDYSRDPDYNTCGHSGPGTVQIQWGAAGVPDTVAPVNLTDTRPVVGRAFSNTYTTSGTYTIRPFVRDNLPSSYVSGGNIPVTLASSLSVSGKVVRLDGTTPVSGASMQMNSSPTKLTTTAADGTYTFTGVAPGNYVIRAVKSGLTFVDQSVVVTNASVTGVNFTANR